MGKPMRLRILPSRLGLSSLAACCFVLASCGEGLNRQRIQGTVTFQGEPVEFGAIFEPTESVGKTAPTVYLSIRDGKYDTGDKGPVRGKYRVVVGGTDVSKPKVVENGTIRVPQLFKDYTFEVDIPPPNNTLDIEIPTSQKPPEQ